MITLSGILSMGNQLQLDIYKVLLSKSRKKSSLRSNAFKIGLVLKQFAWVKFLIYPPKSISELFILLYVIVSSKQQFKQKIIQMG